MRLRDAIGFAAVLWVSAGLSLAQGTKLWSVGRYEEMERGTPEGVAISSEGELMAGPALRPVYTAEANFLWSVAAVREGVSYVGLGGATAGSAAVMRVGADGRAVKVFSGPEMQVQAIRVGADGTVYVATSPGGKVYRLGTGAGAATVVFDPSETAEKPNYLWDLAIGGKGELYVAAGAPAAVYRVAASGKEGVRGRAELLFRTADQHMRSLLLGRDGTMLWAGSDGEGVIYRFETERAGARPFAAYAAAKREITSLAMDGAAMSMRRAWATRGR